MATTNGMVVSVPRKKETKDIPRKDISDITTTKSRLVTRTVHPKARILRHDIRYPRSSSQFQDAQSTPNHLFHHRRRAERLNMCMISAVLPWCVALIGNSHPPRKSAEVAEHYFSIPR